MPMSNHVVSSEIPDWSREHKSWFAWDPARSLLGSVRSYQRHKNARNPIGWAAKKMAVLRHRFWSVISGAEIPLNCRIGGGLLMPHPNGIVIHPGASIGPNCLILQQVTIGYKDTGIPTIGGHVDIGAGAKVLGGIVVGNHVAIGANAVVLGDVPDCHMAVGVPAQVRALLHSN